VSTGHEIMLSASPPIIYTPIFLNHVYPDFQGFISPSGRYHLKIDTNYAGVYSETPVVSTLWLIDTTGAKPMVKVLDGADMFYRDAFWFPGEAKVVFGIGPEFGTELYLLDISSGKLNSISDLTGFNDTGLLEWCLSPDGEKIAVVDGQGNLQVISLDGASVINFPGFYQNLRWSHDSQMIYYYHGPDWYEVEDLGVYDLRSEKMPTLFTLSELHRHGIFGAFDVSPLGNKIVFWRGGEIRLIILSDCPGQMNGGGE
jgi:Tol biopolymer transport system component